MPGINNILETLGEIFLFLFKFIYREYKKVLIVGKGDHDLGILPLDRSDKQEDILSIFTPTRFFFLFNLLALFVFVVLPQGNDILLIVIESLKEFNFKPLLSLILGLIGWSVVAEFGARYKIYVSDNSGMSLDHHRVEYRKQLQRFFSMIYLMLPFWIVIVSVAIVSFRNLKTFDLQNAWPFLAIFLSLAAVLKGLTMFIFSLGAIGRLANRPGSRFKLPPAERRWVEKLYGIYNDYVMRIRNGEFFPKNPDNPNIHKHYENFVEQTEIQTTKGDFPDQFVPQRDNPESDLPPTEFDAPRYVEKEYRIQVEKDKDPEWVLQTAGYHRWIYKNNPNAYPTLHFQVKLIAILSLIATLLLALGIPSPEIIQAPGLVCFAFGSWLGIYTGLLYIDKRYRRKFWLSFRWLLFVWMLICSKYNQDHPLRTICCGSQDTRPSILTHFHNWYDAHHKKDSTQTDSLQKYPVIFITAEGGASRTGAFTAMILSRLQDSFPGFRNDIYACSSVSGGSLGFSFFNAINYLDIADTPLKKDYYLSLTKEYFKKDFLSPVLAKMFYGEAFNTISFWDIQLFDRAIALEKSWEDGYHDLFKEKNAANIYAATWQSLYAKNPLAPAWFINTTEVETGQQCFISNVRQDSAQFFHRRDLLVEKIPGSINYSTAVNFSTRFPLISPSAAVEYQGKRLHYVDGGYVENSGSLTMLEVLRTLEKDDIFKRHVIPFVIQLRFGDKDEFGDTRFVNEINSIVSGLYNLRSGNCDRAVDDLQHFTEKILGGVFMPVRLPASSKEVPLNWTLSRQSIDKYLDGYVDTIFRDPNQALHKLYWFKH